MSILGGWCGAWPPTPTAPPSPILLFVVVGQYVLRSKPFQSQMITPLQGLIEALSAIAALT